MITKLIDWQRPKLAVDRSIEQKVAAILLEIAKKGDLAIDAYAIQFDQQDPKIIALKPFDQYQLESALANAIRLSAERIEKFALFQKENGATSGIFTDESGEYGQDVSALQRIGAYIPGGRFPLISTALMTLIPAKVAGCPVRIACSPSDHPAIQAAASLAGATKFVQIGGVQAIAMLANGYAGEAPVDLVVGPGNAWVNEAKKQIQSSIKIDGLAGPSELVALCDGHQPIEWLAMDALAQAEHDPLACSIIASDDEAWLIQMAKFLSQKSETKKLIENQQIELILADSTSQLIDFSNQYAAEHLMLCHEKIKQSDLLHYGSLFVGANSAVALGDYISGPNHTLPTLGYAKQNGGLNVASFQKITTTQKITEQGRNKLSQSAMPIAQAEGLDFHYQSLKVRVADKN